MTSYSEEEIRYAFRGWLTESSGESFLRRLHNNREKSVLSDDDTVTVKEIRDAEKALQVRGQGSTIYSAEQLLRKIHSSREPEYPVNSVWKDANGMVWLRVADDGGGWACFGSAGTYSLNSPKRPLKRMDVI